MKMKLPSLALAFAAGLAGGLLSQGIATKPVLAESPAPTPKEVRAQSFVLVNEAGSVLGKFSLDGGGRPAIRLFDSKGREIWSVEGPVLRVATGR
ncbi:MAG TPA: hypothetical protein VJW51_04975 [Candidatus Acidoferrales bacterium]|nr:hypothetical protein [Candidatus Acidoferrales bacterium]